MYITLGRNVPVKAGHADSHASRIPSANAIFDIPELWTGVEVPAKKNY